MAVTPFKAFLFAGGGIVAAAGVAYVSGALDPYFNPRPPAEVAALNPPASSGQPAEVSPGTGVHDVTPPAATGEAAKPAGQASVAPAENTGAATPAAPAADAMKPAAPADAAAAAPASSGPAAPTFDIVRVEENGSVVVAGNAAPNAKVEILNGSTVIGSTTAGPDGAFAIVLDDPLKPGDYQFALRATTPDNAVVASGQVAVVSIPDKPGGQVLAMVEEPGKAAQLLTLPEPAKQPAATSTQPATGEAAPADATQPAVVEAKPAPSSPAPAAGEPKVVVEAVEIDGNKIFVAGLADPGRKVRAYANEIVLGDGVTSPDGHFLVEAARDLPVGTYTVRVDALDADGVKVVARATVPFEREPGESIAAVAPPEQAKPAAEKPAQIASAQGGQPAAGSQTGPAAAGTAGAPAATPVDGQTPAATAAAPAQPAPAAPEKSTDVAAATPADGVPETVSPKLEHANGAVIIRRKDTLWRISRRVYGHGTRYSTIYLANQDQISDPDKIWPGQVFRVPETSKEGEAANLKAMGEQATTAPTKTE